MRETIIILQWIAGGLEAILGIPLIGGTIVISLLWTPLLFMAVLHIVTLVLSVREGTTGRVGSILGIITSCVAWIPFVGMVMHIISAIFLMIDAAKK